MARAQVREILGTPLVTSLFHADRWDYAFSIRRQGVPQQNFQLTLFFKGDVLQSVEGSDLPSESEFVGRLEAKRKGVRVPNLQASEEDLKKFPSQSSSPMDERKAPQPASYPPLEPAPR
jgi:outer membrane protein assembly factor BamE